MLERLQENTSVWERLKGMDKPIVLYGMGDGALKIMAAFKKFGIPPLADFSQAMNFPRALL